MTEEVRIPVPLHLMGYKEWAVVAAIACIRNGGSFTITPQDTEDLNTGPYANQEIVAYIDGDKNVHFKLQPISTEAP